MNLLEVSEAEVAALKEQAPLANTDSLTRILEVLADAELRLRDAASKKILLEVSAAPGHRSPQCPSLDAVLKQLNQLRGQSGAGVRLRCRRARHAASGPADRANRKTASVPHRSATAAHRRTLP